MRPATEKRPSGSGQGAALRLLLPHGKLATALEDVSFLLVWAAALLCFSTVLARGEFRGYYWMGSALGFLLYRCTLGCVTVPLLRRIGVRIAGSIPRASRMVAGSRGSWWSEAMYATSSSGRAVA